MTPRTVLLTGGTGFLGGCAAAHLLRAPDPPRQLLLARAASPADAERRLRASLARFGEPGPFEAVCADLTDRRALDEARLDEVTHVLHLGANTSFRSVRGARHANILGTLTLAHRMRRAPRLARFLHVGTAYACGAAGARVVREDDYPRYGARHLIEYTASKAEAELLLENTAPELPLVVARPSVVIGHTRLGCRPSASLFWYYRAMDLLRRSVRPLHLVEDVVPVDYVADALLLLLFKPGLRHRRYHISAGEGSSVAVSDIAAAFARHGGGGGYEVVEFAAIERDRDRLRQVLGPGDEETILTALRVCCAFAALPVEVFENSRLLAEGMPPPPRFTSYLDACITAPTGRSVYEQMADEEPQPER